ncbi:CRISPR-associated exonuclease, Cas4 family [Desulfocapsa sulfexigens DSM 10523]|uniref:CRISPR-associated exonuclease Cas4 n=1 Tax=Desulfocapsa sulfexigens (strain DSM 10523 / SB164P1) TaxID=1167006 RepID=M1PES1_DESSD|nr:CRISPR-associated protein Cas4 [Desulfocapsa sulfexigens]AGF80042.1 CRISPR-associated exonuclease, Cas4 family [Desulfocapsa sulfexigens DSM 10523]
MTQMFTEDNLHMLSALQHLLFCPRQCALIHIEQLWEENRLTAEGRIMHERVHKAGRESRKDKRIEYDLPLHSLELGIAGRADVVEFYKIDKGWQPFPVEYKRGKAKKDDSDRVQLCAQAICLEEMLGIEIEKGAMFYGTTHRRLEVVFDNRLRQKTRDTSERLHLLLASKQTPKPEYSNKCKSCSFESLCLPKVLSKRKKVAHYLEKMLK